MGPVCDCALDVGPALCPQVKVMGVLSDRPCLQQAWLLTEWARKFETFLQVHGGRRRTNEGTGTLRANLSKGIDK